jgi:hypothetical protein
MNSTNLIVKTPSAVNFKSILPANRQTHFGNSIHAKP